MPTTQPTEPLEPRRLLSAALEGGVLYVTGRVFPDEILIRYDASRPTVGPVISVDLSSPIIDAPALHWDFPADAVRAVIVRSGFGDDLVDLAIATYPVPAVDTIRPVPVPSRVDGGLGRDTVYGGSSRDSIAGNFGDDLLFGTDGNDVIDGGRGDDTIRGGNGNDFLHGGLDDDDLAGDFGNDSLSGGHGNDRLGSWGVGPLPSEPGDDVLSGGPGNDSLLGGQGKDRIFGGLGRDTFYSEDSPTEWLDKQGDEPVEHVPTV